MSRKNVKANAKVIHAKKDTENFVDMKQNANSKVRVHVNLSMNLNYMKK